MNGQCDGIKLMIDDQPLGDRVVYKPVGSSGVFVTCHKCDDNINKPSWHSLITHDRLLVCSEAYEGACSSKEDSGTRGLKFLNFTSSLAGSYECRIYGGFRLSVNISVLGKFMHNNLKHHIYSYSVHTYVYNSFISKYFYM